MRKIKGNQKGKIWPDALPRLLAVCLALLLVVAMPIRAAAETEEDFSQSEQQETVIADQNDTDEAIDKNTDEDLNKNLDKAPDENLDKDIDEDIDENIVEDIDKGSDENLDKNIVENIDKDTDEDIDEDIDDDIDEDIDEDFDEDPIVGTGQQATATFQLTTSRAVTGAGDGEDETYSVPDGSAYILELGKTLTYTNDANKGSAIQQGLEGALTYINGLYADEDSAADRTATLVVSKGTYENGITLGENDEENDTLKNLILTLLGYQEQSSDDTLTLRIVAEDAIEYDDEGNVSGFNADASGEVQLEGDVNILAGSMRLNLVLAGLYYSTRGMVNADSLESLTIYGTEKDDYITVNATNVGSNLTVDTGSGDDVVVVTVSGQAGVSVDVVTYVQLDILLRALNDLEKESFAEAIAKAEFSTEIFGENFTTDTILKNLSKVEELKQKLENAAKNATTNPIGVDIITGDGNDKLNLNLLDSTRLESGKIEDTDVTVDVSQLKEEWKDAMKAFPVSWLTKMSLYVDVASFNVNVDGGDGADSITVTGERDASNAYPLVKASSDYVFEKGNCKPTATITVNGGAGDDVITINNSVFLATRGDTKVTADGGTGFDRLHLTGVLNSDEANPISGNVTTEGVELSLEALAALVINDGYTNIDYKLSYPGAYTILSKNMDAYTDTLENKKTVTIKDLAEKTTAEAFTNYVVEPDASGIVSFDASEWLEGSDLLLANILIKADNVTIQKLLAEGFNVTIDSDDILVEGTVRGRNILLLAEAEDKALVEIDASGSVDTGLTDGILPSEVEIEGATLGIYEAKNTVSIRLTENAKLLAQEAVAISAILNLYHDFIPGLELLDENNDIKFNPVTVKLGNASIHITGTIHAGGSIQIGADVNIDVDVNNGELKAVIPVSIGVIGGKATVTVEENADIRSGLPYYNSIEEKGTPTKNAGTFLRADSTLRIASHGGSGVIPFSVALAVVEFETAVTVTGNAAIVAGGDVELLARNHTVTSVSVCGYETSKWNVKVKSGVFLAGTYGDVTTTAKVGGSASLRSMQGDVRVNGISRLSNNTVAVAIPAADKDAELTLSGAVKILANLIDLGGITKTVAPKLLEKAGLEQLTDLFKKATESSKDDDGSQDALTQFMGAFAWAYLENNTTAVIDTTGTVAAAGTLHLYALGEVRSQVRGDGSLYKTSSVAKDPDKAIGAGLALVILRNKADASIEKGTITAGGLELDALLGSSVSYAVAKSGHVPDTAKLGLAGAVGVQLASFENTAAIRSGVVLNLKENSTLTVSAKGSGRFVTVGDASGKRKRLSLNLGAVKVPLKSNYGGSGDSTGVGAGIAVDTISVDSYAGIEDDVTITGTLAELLVEATFEADHYVEAAAGAQGGTSATPVVALSLSGMHLTAYVGSGAALAVAGDVQLNAAGRWERTLVADAETAGVKVGIGAAVGVLLASDDVSALLNRSVNAKNVTVTAESISRVTETIKASSKGVKPNSGSGTYGQGDSTTGTSDTQQKVEDLISGSKTDSAEKTSTGGVDSTINKLISTLSGLAGKLSDGKSSANAGNLNSGSVDSMGSSRQPAGTSEGNVEVAAAIGVNIQHNTVLAQIGDGLTITATGDVTVASRQDTDATVTANASAVKSTTGVGVAVAVNCVRYDNRAIIGNGTVTAGGDIKVLATIVEDAEKRAVEEILSDLVKYFASQNGMETLLKTIADKKNTTVDALMDDLLKEYHSDYNNLKEDEKKKLADEITKMLMASLSEEPLDTSVSLATDVLESILGEFRDMVSDPQFFLDLFAGNADSTIQQKFDELKLDGKMTLESLRAILATALTEKFGNPSELDGIGCRITTITVSGEGAANVGVAGSAAVSHVDGTTLAQINGSDKQIKSGGIVTIEANAAQKIYTTATASTVANGQPNKTGNASEGAKVGVGASFAMTLAEVTAKAILGENRNLTAKALGVKATAQNDVDTIAIAGQDPIGVQQKTMEETGKLGDASTEEANNSTAKDIAADAAVAVTVLSNTVYAQVCPGCKLTLTGGDILNSDLEEVTKDGANLIVSAYQRGQTYTGSSGFAVQGKKAAVGGSVAVNVAGSDVLASLAGSGSVKGKVLVQALTSNEDEVNALAVVTGLNLDRYLSKIRSIVDLANTTDKPSTGSINSKVVNAINGKAGSSFGGSANKNLPLSGMLMQKLNIKLPDTDTNQSTKDALNENGGGSTGQQFDNSTKGQTVNIAAALGVNITNHRSVASLDGTFETGSAQVTAENRGNFRTTGSGATVTAGNVGSNNISAGVAVSVNNNRTESILGGSLTTKTGGVELKATSTQNMDGKYPGLLAAQAIAGAVGSTGGKVGLAGAVAVVVNQAQTRAFTKTGTKITAENANITVAASDKSKLALRAGALQAGGQTAGVGASFAILYGENGVTAEIGGTNTISAKDLSVTVIREAITAEDYVFPFDKSDLFTVNAKDDDTRNKGLININISDTGSDKVGDNSLELNLKAENLLSILDLLNYGTMTNYYVEAISGSIQTSPTSNLAVAGAVSFIYATADTLARIGDGSTITLTGELKVEAENQSRVRQIAGALGATTQNGVGVNVTGYVNERTRTTWDADGTESTETLTDQTIASIGSNAKVTAPNGITVSTKADLDVMAIAIAAAAVTSVGNGASIGGTLSTIAAGNVVKALVGEKTTLSAGKGSISVNADNTVALLPISASVEGGASKVAAGGTISAIVVENETEAAMGDGVVASAKDDILVKANAGERLINWLASAAVSTGNNVAGTISVLITDSKTTASLGDGANLTSKEGTVSVIANGDVFQVVVLTNAGLGFGSGSATVGAVVGVDIFRQKVEALVGEKVNISAGDDVVILAQGKNRAYLITAAGSAGTTKVAVSGTITTVVSNSTVRAELGNKTNVQAGDTIGVSAGLDADLIFVCPNFSATTGVGVGAAVSTMVVKNTVSAILGDGVTLTAKANGNGYALNRENKRKGIFLKANANTRLILAAANAGLATGTVGAAGSVVTVTLENKVTAQTGDNVTLMAGYETDSEGALVSVGDGEVSLEADDDSDIYIVSGTFSGGSTAGVGASVVTVVAGSTVAANTGKGASLRATGDVTVQAKANNKCLVVSFNMGAASNVAVGAGATNLIYQNNVTAAFRGAILSAKNVSILASGTVDLVLAAGILAASGTASVAGGENALVFCNTILAELDGNVEATGNVTVQSVSKVLAVNAAGAVGASGEVAVIPVAVVTYYKGSNQAIVKTGSRITAGGAFTLRADSTEDMSNDAIGVGASGTVAVSGAVVVTVSTQVTRALAEADVSIQAASVTLAAEDTIRFLTATGVIAGSGEAAVGILAGVTVLHNTVEAKLTGGSNAEKNTVASTGGDISVTAKAKRDVRAYALDVSASGAVSVAPSVMVLVIGGKLDKDSSALLKEGFNATAFAENHENMDGLAKMLESDDRQYSDITINSGDYSTGYVSGDMENGAYNDTDKNRGEDYEFTDGSNATINGTSNILNDAPRYDPEDAVSAIVGSVKLTSAKDITVTAEDLVQLELYNVAVTGSGVAAVGAGLSVAVLYSNVVAGVESGATLDAKGNITVKAISHSDSYKDTAEDTSRNKFLSKALGEGVDLTQRAIRVISAVASGSQVSVSVVGSALSLSNRTMAYLNGNVTKAEKVSVLAEVSYPNTLVVTTGAAGGLVGVTASFAVAVTQAEVSSGIGSNAMISGAKAIEVKTDTAFQTNVISAALAAGGAGVNGGVAVSVNRMKVHTYVGQNVTVSGATSLDVTATHTSAGNVWLMNVAAGGVAAGISGVVTILSPEIYTYIGLEPNTTGSCKGSISAGTVTVTSTVTTTAQPKVLLATGGAEAISGMVIVVINDTDVITGIQRKNVTATGALTVTATMTATAEADFSSTGIGTTALGATIVYVRLRSSNQAVVDVTGVTVTADSLTITATGNANANAKAYIVSAGSSTVNGNIAIADNGSKNFAMVTGTTGELSCTGAVKVEATGTATAIAELVGLSASIANVNASVVVALLRSVQKAVLAGKTVTGSAISVTSTLNADTDESAKATITVGSGALASLKAFVALAYGRSESLASVTAKTLTATGGDLTVATSGKGGTSAKITQLSVDGITGTVLAAFAYAQAKFQAIVESGNITAENVTVKAEDITVTAVAEVTPTGLPVNASLVDITVNLAIASVKATIEAILRNATVTATNGNVTISAISNATATAEVKGTAFEANAVEVTAGVAKATLAGTQTAAISGGSVTAQKVNVTSQFNYQKSYKDKPYDAHATIGSSTGTAISYVSVKANTALATVKTAVSAKIENATVTATDDGDDALKVLTQGSSRAKAEVSVGNTIGAGNATIMITKANAAGDFLAEVKNTQLAVNGTVTIWADSVTEAVANTANAGTVEVNAITGKYNRAEAIAAGTTKSGFTGNGTVGGSLTVKADGNVTADAKTLHPKITVSIANLAANQTIASLTAKQSAQLKATGDLKVGGGMNVKSTLTANATGDVGGGSGNVSITGLTASVNTTKATSATENQASITGTGKIIAKAVDVLAKSTTSAIATTKQGIDASLASFGGLTADALTTDTVEAQVTGVTMDAYSLSVNAEGDATANATSNAVGSLSGISSRTSEATAGIGSEKKKQTVKAGIGKNTTITLTGDLLVKALNKGTTEAAIIKGTGVAVLDYTKSKLPTVSYYDTQVYADDGSKIRSGGEVTFTAQDDTTAKSQAESKTISFLFHASEVFGSNKITTDTLVKIGACTIFATDDLTIKAVSNATMIASTKANGGSGFEDKNNLKAENTLTRTAKVTLADNASLESDFGDLEILAQAGTNDSIQTSAGLSGSGFAAYEKTSVTTTISATSMVTLGKAEITDTFGTVHIWADASMGKFYSNAYSNAEGVGTNPSATVEDTITLSAQVTIDGGTITGRNVEIHTRSTKLVIESFAEAKAKAFGANVDAKTVQKVTLSGSVEVKNATLRGYDYLRITATMAPEYQARNIYARAKIYLGAIGHGKAETQQVFVATTKATIGANVIIYSANATIRASECAATVVNKQETSGFVYQDKENKESSSTISASTSVNESTKFYIGDAAAGIVIDIYEEKGQIQIRHVGLKNEKPIWTVDGKDIAFQPISNNLAGYLTMDVTGGNYTVYDQLYIPYVRITNRTDANLELSGLTVENDNYIKPRVTLKDGSYTVQETDNTRPEFTVTNRSTGNVHVKGLIANPRGSVSFLWTGTTGGNLTSVKEVTNVSGGGTAAPIWAHSLTIRGANNVGTGEDDTFNLWLVKDTDNSQISVDATGKVFLALIPVWMETVAAERWDSFTPDTTDFDPEVDVGHIKSLGDVYLLLETGIRVYRKAGTKTITMPVPGTLEFVTGEYVNLTSSVTVTADKLTRYLESYDLATGVSVYYLPNGTRIYTDANGEIFRITEGGVDFDLGAYGYDATSQTITLAEGVTFSLNTGCLNVAEGYSFDALLSAISGKWLMDNIKNGTFQLFHLEEAASDDEDPVVTVSGIEKWLESGSLTYYKLTVGTAPDSIVGGSAGEKNYVLVYDSATDSLKAYLLTGKGEGGASQSNYDEVTFYTKSGDDGHHDSYYDSLKDAYTSFTDWNGNTFDVVYRTWWKDANGNYSSSKSDNAELVGFYLVKGDYTPDEKLNSEYTFTSFLDVSSERIGQFQNLSFDDSTNTWKVTYLDNGKTVTVELDKVCYANGYFFVQDGTTSSDSVANAVYQQLAGKVWKMKRKQGESFVFNACTWLGTVDSQDNREYSALEDWPLYSYYYECTYATLEEIGLTMTPVDGENVDYTHKISFDTGSNGTIILAGKTEGIQMKEVTVPGSGMKAGTKAYRITNTLYIQSQGNDKGLAILLNGNFTATYDSRTGIYESTKTKIEGKGKPITLKSGEQVTLEAITDSVAKDIQGNYWTKVDGEWTKLVATVSGDTTTLKKEDGTLVLTIRETNGDTFVTFPNGTVVGSDGTVKTGETAETTQKTDAVTGTDYKLGDITGSTVTIKMKDETGSLLDGNGNATNITATVGDVTFITASSGSIGTKADPLEIVAKGDVKFQNLSNATRLETDTYLKTSEDITFGELTVSGKKLDAESTAGSITFGQLTMEDNALVSLKAKKEITLGDTDVQDSTLTATAEGSISSTGTLTATDSKVTLNAGKGISLKDVQSKGSTLTATAGDDLNFHILEAEDSEVTLTAGKNILSDGYLRFRKGNTGKLTLSAGEDIGSEKQNLLLDTDDTLYISKTRNYYIDSVELVGSTPFQRQRPTDGNTGSGRDEYGNQQSGEILKPNVATDTVNGELGITDNSQIAQMVIDRAKDASLSLLSTAALENLIRSGSISTERLAELLAPDMTAQDIAKAEAQELAEELSGKLDTLDNETLVEFLTQSLENDQVDREEMAKILSSIVTQEELDEMLENAWANADYDSHKNTQPAETTPRKLDIQVTEATGAAFVKNLGDITITQETGTLTAGAITSSRGDVTLTAETGGIQGNGDDQTDITGGNITLNAAAGVGNTTQLTIDQQTVRPTLVGNISHNKTIEPMGDGWALKTEITFDWLRVRYGKEATRLNVTATGDVDIREVDGDLGLGTVNTTGNVTLTATGSIRNLLETGENITTNGDVTLTGDTIGTEDAPITTNVGGTVYTTAEGDIYIRDSGDLTLVADSATGLVNATAKDNMQLRNTAGDLHIGSVNAGGNATIASVGNLTAELVKATSIGLTAAGAIGTSEKPVNVDTDSQKGGTLSAKGSYLNIAEVSDDLILKAIESQSDALISAPGSILSGNSDPIKEAEDAAKKAINAKAEADKAEAAAQVLEEKAKRTQEALEKAQAALDALKADPDATEEAIRNAEKALSEAKDAHEPNQIAAEQARAEANAKKLAAETLQKQAEDAKAKAETSETTVTVAGDLTLRAGEDIGKADNRLDVTAPGSITAESGGNIYLSGVGDMTFTDIDVPGTVDIATAGGSITGSITADRVNVSAIGGNVGQPDDYLEASTGHLDAMGDNVFLRNAQATEIGQILAKEQVVLESNGDVTGSGTKPGIVGKDITIRAEGDIGTKDEPLDISGDAFHGTAEEIHLKNHTPTIDISHVKSDVLDVSTDGNLTGRDNTTKDITIRADGFVGSEENPFTFWANGIVDIKGALGTWYRNLYTPDTAFFATLVLRFDVTINGQEYSLYILLRVTESGGLRLLGCFLCQGEADEAFWQEVIRTLQGRNISLGLVLHHGELALTRVWENALDLTRNGVEIPFRRALAGLVNADMLDKNLTRVTEAVEDSLSASFDSPEQVEQTIQTQLENLLP